MKFIFVNEDSGFKILSTRTQAGKNLTITGEFGPDIVPEAIAIFHGEIRSNKYGPQLKASSYLITHNAQELASIKIFLNSITEFVGPERSEALIAYFGTDTFNIIENKPERLLEVPGIGPIIADNIKLAWQNNREKWAKERTVYSLRAFLCSLGLKEKKIKKVINHFTGREGDAETFIKNNPYSLIELDDFGFTTVDYIARNLGTPLESPERFKAFIFYLLDYLCPSNGHLYMTSPEIVEQSEKYCKDNNTQFLNTDISSIEVFEAIKGNEKIILEDEIYIYSKRQHELEKNSAYLLEKNMNEKSDLIFLTDERIAEFIEKYEHEHQIELSDEQKQALYYFAEKKVFVITGLPGTGKTSILKAIVELAKSLKLDLTCMTPTGISAKKLSTVINSDAYTIHRRLGFKGGSWSFNELRTYRTDVAIIDESSMVDQEVFYRMLSALEKRTHLIFVGDHNQLPSVGAGNVLRELINCGQVPVVKLEKIFRQAEASDIIKASHRIIQGDTNLELFKDNPTADISFLRIKEVSEIEKLVVALSSKFKTEKREFQILSPRNTGPCGVDSLNQILQETLNPPGALNEMKIRNFTIRVGDRIMVRKNDYENEIFNGDIGKVINIARGKILFSIDDRMVELSADEVNDKIKLAYSITVHKCLKNDAPIYTPEGLVRMGQIEKGDLVQTKNGPFKVVRKSKTGKKRITKIITRTGTIYESSEDHQYLIAGTSGISYKKAADITTQDFLCIYREGIEGSYQKTDFKNISNEQNSIALNLPPVMNEDLCWLLGVLIGDSSYRDKKDGMVELSGPTKPEILDRARKIFNSLGLTVNSRNKNGKPFSIYVISINFRAWLLSIGLNYSVARDKTIPEIIFKSPISCRASFIGGLFDTDGCADKGPQIRMTTASEKLARGIKDIFLTIGIISFWTSQNPLHHKITISGKDLIKFKEMIPIIHFKKRKRLENYKISTKSNHYEIPFGKILIDLFLKTFKEKEGNSRGIQGKGLYSKYTSFYIQLNDIKNNRNKFRQAVLDTMEIVSLKENLIISEIIETKKNNWYYDQIVSITSEEEEATFEIEVENEHSYIYNGAICHNSQGLEYQTIILIFINQFGRNMLQRNLLYTALTRAKKKVIMIGHGSAIERAIENTSVIKRNTRLGERIRRCLELRKSPSSYTLP